MPLAHILAPQLARSKADIERELGHPSPGYLQSDLPYPREPQAFGPVDPAKVSLATRLMGAKAVHAHEGDKAFDKKAEKPTPKAYLKRTVAADRNTVQRAAPQDNMPIYDKGDSLGREMNVNDIAALVERGQPVPQHLYQGLHPDDIARAHALGSEMRGYGGAPSLQAMPRKDTPSMQTGPYTGRTPELAMPGAPDSMEQHKGRGAAADRIVRKVGYLPQMFDGRSSVEAAQIIADQLQAQRERAGDPTAWWAAATTSI